MFGTVRYLVRSVPYLIQFLAPPRVLGTCLLGLHVPLLVSHTCRDHVSFDDTHISLTYYHLLHLLVKLVIMPDT